jgi:hypothetical protein
MDELRNFTQEEADLLIDLLWVAKTEAEARGEDTNIFESISNKIDEQAIAYGYAE